MQRQAACARCVVPWERCPCCSVVFFGFSGLLFLSLPAPILFCAWCLVPEYLVYPPPSFAILVGQMSVTHFQRDSIRDPGCYPALDIRPVWC